MSTVGWMLIVAVGIALGFSLGRMWPGQAAKLAELQRERDAAREDLANYRGEVGAHFERTAELFDKVTADYRSLYEHLSLSARQLGAIRGESERVPLAEPERRQLAAAETGAASAAAGAAEEEPAPKPPRDWAEPESEPGPEPEKAAEAEGETEDAGIRPRPEPPEQESAAESARDSDTEDDAAVRRKLDEPSTEAGTAPGDEPGSEPGSEPVDEPPAADDDSKPRETAEEKPRT